MNYGMNILVVDDMEGMRRLVVTSLAKIGFKNVVTAIDGADAWFALQKQPVDVVISDWNMPGMNGLELLKAIREKPQFAHIPVMMMTAETDRHQVQTAIAAGVAAYLVKPFSTASLEARLNTIFAGPASQQKVPVGVPAELFRRPASRLPPVAIGSHLLNAGTTGENAARKDTLLVVDDMPDNLDILVALLGEKYSVRAANSGLRALAILASGKIPDLILLDVMMPEMDGFEVCRRIKSNSASADVPVIFLTAMNETTDVMRGFDVGAVDFVTKPVDPPILLARIRTHLKMKHQFGELKRSRVALMEKNAVLEDNLRLREQVELIARHDLKNPIAGIIGFASALMEDELLASDHKEILSYIEQSAYAVQDMVTLSTDIYRMEQGTYSFTPTRVDMAQLVRRILNEKKSELTARKIAVNLLRQGQALGETAFYAFAEELLCYSMLSNLIRNAIEASGQQEQIGIDFSQDGDRIKIDISNRGAVLQEVRQNFFDKFSTAGKQGGTGLGTFSARLIARTQNGDLAMQTSDEDNTTLLTVTLPGLPKDAQ